MYDLQMSDDGTILQAEVSGVRSPIEGEMALASYRFWAASIRECQARGLARLLIVSRLEGWVSTAAVLSTVTYLAHTVPQDIVKIGYVDLVPATLAHNKFGERVGAERGLHLAVFDNEEAAREWLTR